jgi:hypothetical protein
MTVSEYASLLQEVTQPAIAEREKFLQQLRKDYGEIEAGKYQARQPIVSDIIVTLIDLYEFEIEVIPKLLFMNYEMLWLYEDLMLRLSNYPTKKQMRGADKRQRVAFAKDLVKSMRFKPIKRKGKGNIGQVPLVA